MNSLRYFALLLLLICAPSACSGGESAPAASSSSPDASQSAPDDGQPSDADRPATPAIGDPIPSPQQSPTAYSIPVAIPLPDGQWLYLSFHGEQLDAYRYGFSEISVFDGGSLLQLISIATGIPETEGFFMLPGYTEAHNQDGGLTLGDFNFDGYWDFSLAAWITAYHNPTYYWTWSPEQQQFVYRFCSVVSVTPNADAQLLLREFRDGPTYYTDTMQWVPDGSLEIIERTITTYGGSVPTTQHYSLADGTLAEAVENNIIAGPIAPLQEAGVGI